jgi:hypothetical protein
VIIGRLTLLRQPARHGVPSAVAERQRCSAIGLSTARALCRSRLVANLKRNANRLVSSPEAQENPRPELAAAAPQNSGNITEVPQATSVADSLLTATPVVGGPTRPVRPCRLLGPTQAVIGRGNTPCSARGVVPGVVVGAGQKCGSARLPAGATGAVEHGRAVPH